eukprot:jgi/Psemu1/282862/fgenesh1_pg.15_\
MRALLRICAVSLLIESTVSLNHANFIGDGNNNAEALEDRIDNASSPNFMEMPEGLFEFFAPLPPLPPPPTYKPSKKPTPPPVPTPNSPPIPAGRFSSPVAKPAPALNPEEAGQPRHPPTFVPIPVPVGRFPPQTIGSPTPPVSSSNHDQPPTFVAPRHSPPPIHIEPDIESRVASYTAEWGNSLDKCQYVVPTVILTCMNGGFIEMTEPKNVKCTRVGNDQIECTQRALDSDSSVEFDCSGTRTEHLMSTATVSSSVAKNCLNGGKAVKFLTLSRKCLDHIDVNPTCTGGIPWVQDDATYCASPVVCSQPGTCNDLPLEPITMSNTNTDARCSHSIPSKNMQDHAFHASSLASITQVDWRISGQKRGCLWKSPPLLMRCQDGGKLEFMENYPFCIHVPERNMAQCQSFAPYSPEKEESIEIVVKCTGKSENQLVLSAEIPSEHLEVECDAAGTIIQSIMLSRGCGEYGTDRFTLINHPSFCDAEEQIFAADDNHAHCFVGDACIIDEGCNNIHLAPLIASTESDAVEKCTFAV